MTNRCAMAHPLRTVSTDFVERPPQLRSRKTNRPFSVPGVDLRSGIGRRYADIIRSLRAEFGDEQPGAINELAATRLALERQQAAIVAGEAVDADALVRLSNLAVRQEARLQALAKAKKVTKPTVTLRDYVAAKSKDGGA